MSRPERLFKDGMETMPDMPMNLRKPELIYDCRHELAEGPVWHQGHLWWVNIIAGELHRLELSSGKHDSRQLGGHLSCAVPAADGRWVLAHKRGLVFFDWNTGHIEKVAEPEASLPSNRFNDGKCDPAGRLWVGTMSCAMKANQGSLYCLDASLKVQRILDGVTVSNGLAWSADGRTLYYTDTLTHRIDAFSFDPRTRVISGRCTLTVIPPEAGLPEGMAIDVNDNLWVALWGGGSVVCFDGRTGVALARVNVPVSQPSSCAFGGPNLDELFITSAWEGMTAEQHAKEPYSGSIFRFRASVQGRPVSEFQIFHSSAATPTTTLNHEKKILKLNQNVILNLPGLS